MAVTASTSSLPVLWCMIRAAAVVDPLEPGQHSVLREFSLPIIPPSSSLDGHASPSEGVLVETITATSLAKVAMSGSIQTDTLTLELFHTVEPFTETTDTERTQFLADWTAADLLSILSTIGAETIPTGGQLSPISTVSMSAVARAVERVAQAPTSAVYPEDSYDHSGYDDTDMKTQKILAVKLVVPMLAGLLLLLGSLIGFLVWQHQREEKEDTEGASAIDLEAMGNAMHQVKGVMHEAKVAVPQSVEDAFTRRNSKEQKGGPSRQPPKIEG